MALLSPAEIPARAANFISAKIRYLFELPQLVLSAHTLKGQLSQALEEVVRMKELELENERLRRLLGLKEAHAADAVSASVIGRD